jgi:glutamate transport system permease protein
VDVIRDAFPDILQAFWLTIRLTFFSAVGSLVFGTILGAMRVSPVPILRGVGTSFVNIFRNTPLTLIVFFSLFGLSYQLGFSFSDQYIYKNLFWLGVLALTVYHSTFVCEVLRAGINTVQVGQAEAARAIGLTFTQNLRHVILPQAFRAVIAPMGSVLIALTKNTTVVVTIGVTTAKGVNEPSGLMKSLIELHADITVLIFAVFAIGFMCLTLPMGLLTSWAAKRWGVVR